MHLLCEEKQALAAVGAVHGREGDIGFHYLLDSCCICKPWSSKPCVQLQAGHGSRCAPLACADWNTVGVFTLVRSEIDSNALLALYGWSCHTSIRLPTWPYQEWPPLSRGSAVLSVVLLRPFGKSNTNYICTCWACVWVSAGRGEATQTIEM